MSIVVSNRTDTHEHFTKVLCDVVVDEKFFVGFSVNGEKTTGTWTDPREFYRVVTQAMAKVNFPKLYECRFGKSGKTTNYPFFVEGESAPLHTYKGCCGDLLRYLYDQRVWHVDAQGKKYFVCVSLMHIVLFEQLWYYAEHLGVELSIECQF